MIKDTKGYSVLRDLARTDLHKLSLHGIALTHTFTLVRRFKPIVAILMLTLFAFASSHPLLESLGLIHQDHSHADGSDQSDRNHEAADGICRVESSHEELQRPLSNSLDLTLSLELLWVLLLNPNLDADPGGGGLSPPPPELGTSWQFAFRAALPVRAPSLAS